MCACLTLLFRECVDVLLYQGGLNTVVRGSNQIWVCMTLKGLSAMGRWLPLTDVAILACKIFQFLLPSATKSAYLLNKFVVPTLTSCSNAVLTWFFSPPLHLSAAVHQVWTCGGELLISTCSHVGHVFRKHTPYSFPGGTSKVVNHNNARLAEVWLDEWKDFYFNVNPGLASCTHSSLHSY